MVIMVTKDGDKGKICIHSDLWPIRGLDLDHSIVNRLSGTIPKFNI